MSTNKIAILRSTSFRSTEKKSIFHLPRIYEISTFPPIHTLPVCHGFYYELVCETYPGFIRYNKYNLGSNSLFIHDNKSDLFGDSLLTSLMMIDMNGSDVQGDH